MCLLHWRLHQLDSSDKENKIKIYRIVSNRKASAQWKETITETKRHPTDKEKI